MFVLIKLYKYTVIIYFHINRLFIYNRQPVKHWTCIKVAYVRLYKKQISNVYFWLHKCGVSPLEVKLPPENWMAMGLMFLSRPSGWVRARPRLAKNHHSRAWGLSTEASQWSSVQKSARHCEPKILRLGPRIEARFGEYNAAFFGIRFEFWSFYDLTVEE